MRGTVMAALAGVFVALLITGGFLALDRVTLHWYAAEDAPGLTATAAEAYAIRYMHSSEESYVGFLDSNWLPDCEAKDHSPDGWLVSCGLTDVLDTGRSLSQILTYLVADDGTVAPFP